MISNTPNQRQCAQTSKCSDWAYHGARRKNKALAPIIEFQTELSELQFDKDNDRKHEKPNLRIKGHNQCRS